MISGVALVDLCLFCVCFRCFDGECHKKAPYFFEKQGVFSRKVGGFLGKGVGF